MFRVSRFVLFCLDTCPIRLLYLCGFGRFIGTTTFRENWANVGGAIYLRVDKPSHVDTWETPIVIYPDDPTDLIFEDNGANVRTVAAVWSKLEAFFGNFFQANSRTERFDR